MMPRNFSAPHGDAEPPEGSGRAGPLPSHALASRRATRQPPALVALPPGDGTARRPGGLARLIGVVVGLATAAGVAVFAFGMKYQSHGAQVLVDLVNRPPAVAVPTQPATPSSSEPSVR